MCVCVCVCIYIYSPILQIPYFHNGVFFIKKKVCNDLGNLPCLNFIPTNVNSIKFRICDFNCRLVFCHIQAKSGVHRLSGTFNPNSSTGEIFVN